MGILLHLLAEVPNVSIWISTLTIPMLFMRSEEPGPFQNAKQSGCVWRVEIENKEKTFTVLPIS